MVLPLKLHVRDPFPFLGFSSEVRKLYEKLRFESQNTASAASYVQGGRAFVDGQSRVIWRLINRGYFTLFRQN